MSGQHSSYLDLPPRQIADAVRQQGAFARRCKRGIETCPFSSKKLSAVWRVGWTKQNAAINEQSGENHV